jgi:phosphoribosyl-AMP cyclohydrolase
VNRKEAGGKAADLRKGAFAGTLGHVMKELEEGSELRLDFTKLQKIARAGAEVVPVVVQDADSREVLVVAYANEAALEHTLKTGVATFWSTSRNELWIKGATSGDTLKLVDVRVNCEQNSLLYLVRMVGGGVCHTKDASGQTRPTCYYRSLREGKLEFLETK